MKPFCKIRPNYFFFRILVALLFLTQTWKTNASDVYRAGFYKFLTDQTDSTKPLLKKDSLPLEKKPAADTVRPLQTDTSTSRLKTDTFRLKISSDSLDAPVRYQAEDSAVVLIREKKIILYGKTKTDYTDISLTAPRVELNQQTQEVTAVNAKDSTGTIIENAHFKSSTTEFTSDTIRYNFKSRVGFTKNTFTQDGEIFVQGAIAKKVNDNTTFIKKARFTTCNLDEPHFAFVTPEMKVINQKLAVSGPAHPEFEGVPVPIWLPFGFYPLSQGRHSGLLPPQFSANEQFGLGLEGLGYYKALNNYWDVKLYGNIYSYGGWSANFAPTYRKRYRYSGAFNFSMQSTKLNFKGDPDYLNNKSYFLTWNHTVDGKARPGVSFSAYVNAGSTKFNQLVPNSTRLNFQNQLGSSIAFSKSWAGKPFNLTLSANHNQNNSTRLVNISLPDAGFSMSTQYPFQKKFSAGAPKWYEKLGFAYQGNFRNQFSFYDSAFSFRDLIDTLQWGAMHNFPVTLALPPVAGGAIIISPGISYSQLWVAQKFRRKWNSATQKSDTVITKGFFTDHQVSFSLSMNTALFGTYQFKNSRIYAIRHVIRPSLSFNYKPDLSGKHYYTDTISPGFVYRFSEFMGALYPGYAEGKNGGISFQLDNNLEMKWRSRKDTGENSIRKIKLIDGYGFSTGYNFLRDSMKLDLINMYLRSTLFEKINITAHTVLSPYQTNQYGTDINKYAWADGKFKLGHLTYGSISVSSSFRSKPKDPKKEEDRKKKAEDALSDPSLIADQRRLLEYMEQNPSEFVDFNIPWQISFGYSLSFSNRLKQDLSGFEKDFTSNVSFNGSFNLTPKWNFSFNGYYDFDSKKLQTFQMGISREMHCWQLSIDVTPVGLFRFFSFSISPKASVLQDLRINRTRSFPNF